MQPLKMEYFFRCYDSFLILILATNVIGYHYKSQQPPRITEHPVDTTVTRHEPATLNCHTLGEPEPSISWYKDGLPLKTAPQDARSHRVLLPAGNLFFLKVVHNRKDSDAGVYWCEATNALGKARSHNATLTVAVIRDEFRLEPQNTKVIAGENVIMECMAPRGIPEPQVLWKKDGHLLEIYGRFRLVNGSHLQIIDTKVSDDGRYQCIAKNIAGAKESSVAVLKIYVKPFMIRSPKNVTALVGSTVDFSCLVGGNPSPDVFWSRTATGGSMPLSRVSVLKDHTLRLENVHVSDEGRYICEANNQAGAVSSMAVLFVHAAPSFTVRPLALAIEAEHNVSFRCGAEGNPKPFIFWSIEGKRALIFPGNPMKDFRALTTTDESSILILQNAKTQHSGIVVICSAINIVGSASTRIRLTVTSKEDRPPPFIILGPSNQTLPENSTAVFSCKAVGNPTPIISWYKDNLAIFPSDRTKMMDATIQLYDLKNTDSGLYTCVASSTSGKATWSARLEVINAENVDNFHQMFKVTQLPPPPGKPYILNQSESTVTITWNQNTEIKSSDIIGYQVEMFVKQERVIPTWKVVARRISGRAFTQHFVTPGVPYMFLIRAENAYGLGPPSELSKVIIENWGNPELTAISEARANLVKRYIVELTDAFPVLSTAVKLVWDVLDAQFVEGLYIYCISLDGPGDLPRNYRMLTVLHTGGTSSFVVNNLEKWSKYQFFIVPFFKTVEGQPSNSRIVRTLEDVPIEPPQHMEALLLNSTAVYIKWKPPPSMSLNGFLEGYKVEIKANGTNEINLIYVGTTPSLLLNNLSAGITYSVKVAAATKAGLGPFSSAARLRLDPTYYFTDGKRYNSIRSHTTNFLTETWFIILLVSMISVMVVLFTTISFVRRQHTLSRKSLNGSRSNGDVMTKYEAPLWLDKEPLPEYSCILPDYSKSTACHNPEDDGLESQYGMNSERTKNGVPESLRSNLNGSLSQSGPCIQIQNYTRSNIYPEYCRISQIADYAEVTASTIQSSVNNSTNSSSPYATTTLISKPTRLYCTTNCFTPPVLFCTTATTSAVVTTTHSGHFPLDPNLSQTRNEKELNSGTFENPPDVVCSNRELIMDLSPRISSRNVTSLNVNAQKHIYPKSTKCKSTNML